MWLNFKESAQASAEEEIQVQLQGWEDPQRAKMATHSRIIGLEIIDRRARRLESM